MPRRLGSTPSACAPRPSARRRPSLRGPAPTPKTAAKVLAALLVIAGIGVAAVYGARQVYFLGIDEGGRITLYRGLPYELPLDLNLYNEVYSVPVQAASLPDRRDSLTDHELRSRDDADSLIEDLESAAVTLPAPPEGGADACNPNQRPPKGGGGGGRRPALRDRQRQGGGDQEP